MEYGCPVCNGLSKIIRLCSHCGQIMRDDGLIENYYGPYSPYDNIELYEPPYCRDLADTSLCIHLFSCPACGYDTRVAFSQVIIG